MKRHTRVLVAIAGVALLGGVVAAGCGGKTKGEVGGEGGGEAALVAFTDPQSKLTLQHPNSWTKTSDNPLSFSGQDAFIRLEVTQQTTADTLAAAKADDATVRAATPGYKAVSAVASNEVKGAAVLSYEWDLERSTITGKPVHERADRYYIALGDGRMAILTGSSPSNTFDREQVRDIALALKVAK